jgi:hypothetical protein
MYTATVTQGLLESQPSSKRANGGCHWLCLTCSCSVVLCHPVPCCAVLCHPVSCCTVRCRFTGLQSFNGLAFTAVEAADAGRLFGVLETTLDGALVRRSMPLPLAHPEGGAEWRSTLAGAKAVLLTFCCKLSPLTIFEPLWYKQ